MRSVLARPMLRCMTTVLRPIRDFAGDVLMPGDAAFEGARRVQNAAVDHVPAMIARCAGAHDVASALRHARERELPVTVRGGGHAPGGFAVGNGALVIDLTRMRAVYVDPARRRVRVQGGATWRVLDAATQAHGLAVTGARMPSVGVAGFTLGSGSGWLERKLGLAGDALRAARVVTADGDVVTASADKHADLFWALRGGGGSFGVVVELEFALHPVGPVVTGGMLGWHAERTEELARAYAALMAEAPDDLGGGLALVHAPPAPFVPDELQGRPIAGVAVLWTGQEDKGEAVIQPLRDLAPAFDAVGPLPYTAFQALLEPPHKITARSHLEAGFLTAADGDVAAALAEHAACKPTPMSSVILQPLGGAFARAPEDATPLGRRAAPWMWQAIGAWFEPAGDAAARAWTGGTRRALARWSAGEAYPNFIADADAARLRAAYGPATFARLQAIRAEWDPDGVLAAGHAIPLAARRTLAR
jgi:FAD/FMN-containing dehydrogenase